MVEVKKIVSLLNILALILLLIAIFLPIISFFTVGLDTYSLYSFLLTHVNSLKQSLSSTFNSSSSSTNIVTAKTSTPYLVLILFGILSFPLSIVFAIVSAMSKSHNKGWIDNTSVAGVFSIAAAFVFIVGINGLTFQLSVRGVAIYVILIAGILELVSYYLFKNFENGLNESPKLNKERKQKKDIDNAYEIARENLASGKISPQEYDEIMDRLKKE
jgi:uncharacterized membrane protein